MRTLKCPNCGSPIEADHDGEFVFCQYCGTKVSLYDQSTLKTERIVDEAKIKEAEIDLKKAEMEEKRFFYEEEKKKKNKKMRLIAAAVCGGVGLICLIIAIACGALNTSADSTETNPISFLLIPGVGGIVAGIILAVTAIKKPKDPNEANVESKAKEDKPRKISIPSNLWANHNYSAIELKLRNAGFTNIELRPIHDVKKHGLLQEKINDIDEISIDGKDLWYASGKYMSDAQIIITYHAYIED